MKKIITILLLTAICTKAMAEEPVRVHCVGEGTRSYKNLGSKDEWSERYYEFYQDSMTEKKNSYTSKFSKEEITQESVNNSGVYKVNPTNIFMMRNHKIIGNTGKLITEQYIQISIDRQTGKWDFMLTDSGKLGLPAVTILVHGICEPWNPENKF